MFKINVTIKTDYDKLQAKAKKASDNALKRAAAGLRLTASRLIRTSKTKSKPGSPPNTRGNKRLRKSIRYEKNGENSYLIGPDVSYISRIGEVHEFGGTVNYKRGNWDLKIGKYGPIALIGNRGLKYRVAMIKSPAQLNRAEKIYKVIYQNRTAKANFPKRPFMRPALDKYLSSIPENFKAIISN